MAYSSSGMATYNLNSIFIHVAIPPALSAFKKLAKHITERSYSYVAYLLKFFLCAGYWTTYSMHIDTLIVKIALALRTINNCD